MGATATTNHSTDVAMTTGGAITGAIASNVYQGNAGTSLPCTMCWVQARLANSGAIQVNIGTAATATLGITLPYMTDGTGASNGWIQIPIDDVSKLYFYGGTNGDDVDIMYIL